MPTLKVKHLNDLDKINYSRDGDAALDLRASSKFVINLDEEKKEIEQDSYSINIIRPDYEKYSKDPKKD